MPSASPPDGSSPDGEVVEVFTGDTLEEAMAAAVAALGPDLTVRRARKVRAGVRGLLGRDRYEVLAVPPDGPPTLRRVPDDDEDVVGSALDALLEAADAREAGGPQARPVNRPVASRPLAARPASDELPPPLRAPGTPSADPVPPAPLPPAPRSSGSPLRRGGRTRAAAPEGEEPRRRGRLLGGAPLADRSPHPDPAVAEHPQPAAAAPAPPAVEPVAETVAEPVAETVAEPVAEPVVEAPVPPVPPRPAPVPPAPRRDAPPPAPPLAVVPEPDADVYDQEADVEPEPVRAPRRRRAPEPAALQDEPDDEPPARRSRGAGPAAEPPAARPSRRPSARKRAGGWSLGALSDLGVPDQVLDALPGPVPRDDLAWVVALTAAIERCVPPAAEPDEEVPAVISGHGLAGAVAVLEAGCRGVTPGTITHAGRTAPATATELALVLRHHVTGGS